MVCEMDWRGIRTPSILFLVRGEVSEVREVREVSEVREVCEVCAVIEVREVRGMFTNPNRH